MGYILGHFWTMRSFLLLVLPALTASFQVGAPLTSRPTALAHSPLISMVQKSKEKAAAPSLIDRMRGVVVKTDTKAVEPEEEDSKSMMQKVKDAGVAGIISYIFWEWAFWGVSIPVAIFGFSSVTGHFPDFSNQDDLAK